MTRILLIEDDLIQDENIKKVINTNAKIDFPFITKDSDKAVELLQKYQIDVDLVIASIELPHNDGIKITQRIKEIRPELPVILTSSIYRTDLVTKAFKNGVNGFLLKDIQTPELLFAINHVSQGGKYVSAKLAEKIIDHASLDSDIVSKIIPKIKIGGKEIQVLSLIADGYTNSEIGSQLFMSKRTVEGIRKKLFTKTQTSNTASLITYAFRNGILSI